MCVCPYLIVIIIRLLIENTLESSILVDACSVTDVGVYIQSVYA